MFAGRGPQGNDEVQQIVRGAKTDKGVPFEKANLEILATLRQKAPADYQRTIEDLKQARISITDLKKMIDAVIKGRIRDVNAPSPDQPPHVDGSRDRFGEHAAKLINCGDVLSAFSADYSQLIAGEERIGKLLYLAGTSRLFPKPMHTAIKGVSSGGKSEVREHALRFFPVESVISFTAVSERALIYEPRDFRHRILCLGEAAGIEEASLQDYLIRELLSSGRLTYSAPQKIGSKIEGVLIEKEGPVSLMITTTRASLHPENETRLLSLEIDDSEAQTARVLDRVAKAEGENHVGNGINFDVWHDFQRWLSLGKCAVVVPWARRLAAMIPPKAVRLRRDLGQFLRAVKAHALINQMHRERDDEGSIIADIETDYVAVHSMLADTIAEAAETRVKETVIDTVCAVDSLQGDDASKGVTAKQVGLKLKIDNSAAWRRLKVATQAGFLVNIETRKRQPGRYRVSDQEIETLDIMPAPPALLDSYERWESRP